jgi:hypothetical protein
VKLYTPERTELIDISVIETHAEGLLIEGKIMGTLPMQALLTAPELRRALGLLSVRIVLKALGMLLLGR